MERKLHSIVKVVSCSHTELFALREQPNINLCWVPGNEKADKLTKRGAKSLIEDAEMEIRPLYLQLLIKLKKTKSSMIEWVSEL